LIDTDEMVVDRAGMSIPALFEARGEAAFRAYEREAAAQCGKLGGRVIATGAALCLTAKTGFRSRKTAESISWTVRLRSLKPMGVRFQGTQGP
jgi:shikimate kinase